MPKEKKEVKRMGIKVEKSDKEIKTPTPEDLEKAGL